MTMEDALRLHAGDEVLWTKPDGSTETIRILEIEYLGNGVVTLMRSDGSTVDVFVSELS